MPEENKVVIRPAEERDLGDILRLYTILDREMVQLQPEFYCLAPRPEAESLRYLLSPNADFLLARVENQIVGFALVQYAGWTPEGPNCLPHRYAELCDLVVAPEYRRRGIGSALLASAKRWTRNRRLEYLELSVLAQNSPALRLYEAHDFVDAVQTMRCML